MAVHRSMKSFSKIVVPLEIFCRRASTTAGEGIERRGHSPLAQIGLDVGFGEKYLAWYKNILILH